MKITKAYLKKVIQEEIENLSEITEIPMSTRGDYKVTTPQDRRLAKGRERDRMDREEREAQREKWARAKEAERRREEEERAAHPTAVAGREADVRLARAEREDAEREAERRAEIDQRALDIRDEFSSERRDARARRRQIAQLKKKLARKWYKPSTWEESQQSIIQKVEERVVSRLKKKK